MYLHPQFHIDMHRLRSQELAKQPSRAHLYTAEPTRVGTAHEPVALRLCSVSDTANLERLAALDGRKLTNGRHLVAEAGGEIIAALPISGGEFVADPFRRTAHLLPQMRRRAAQLSAQSRPRRNRAASIAARVLHPAR